MTPLEVGILGTGPLATAIVHALAGRGHATRRVSGIENLDGLQALVIVSDVDADNLETALLAKRMKPGLHIVVRVFDPILEDYLERNAPDIRVMSMSAVAAPLVLQSIGGALDGAFHGDGTATSLSGRPDRTFAAMLGVIALIVTAGTVYFKLALGLSLIDAFYFVVTTITTTGYGDITPKDASASVKLVCATLMLSGTCSFAILFALAADWMFARRLERIMGRIPTKWRGHFVIAGAGNMTVRVAALLRERQMRVIVIERDEHTRSLHALRSAGHHVLIGDATREETLVVAGGFKSRGILALTDNDATNLQIALIARAQNPKAEVLARIDSPLLCEHIAQDDALTAFSPIAVAAKAFADAVEKLDAKGRDA
ncbi:MAG: NAD-binding protein [Deltaproteobacteria bacterium]|nr:NAD-binding protein [Deltaproteobacteria bacterium]